MIKPRERKIIFGLVIAAIIAALLIGTGTPFLVFFTYSLVAFLIIGGAIVIALTGTAFIYWAFDDECHTYNEVWTKMLDELKKEFS